MGAGLCWSLAVTLSDQQIHNFIEAWRNDFGETLSPEAAEKEATHLLAFFTTMAEGLTRQRAAKEESERMASSRFNDHDNRKAVWQKTMKMRR